MAGPARHAKADDKLDWNPTYRSTLRDVREMAAAGMLILSGTDVPVVTLIPGYSLHDELELLVKEAGMTPLAALASSTINAAKVVGVADSIGQVKAGYVRGPDPARPRPYDGYQRRPGP
jgi:imidazolonepropionase-like amidohydrolase